MFYFTCNQGLTTTTTTTTTTGKIFRFTLTTSFLFFSCLTFPSTELVEVSGTSFAGICISGLCRNMDDSDAPIGSKLDAGMSAAEKK